MSDRVFAAPPVRLGDDEVVVLTATSPWVTLLGHEDRTVREHALLVLKRELWAQPWRFWRPVPPRIVNLEIVKIRSIDRALAWLVTLYALWRTLCR